MALQFRYKTDEDQHAHSPSALLLEMEPFQVPTACVHGERLCSINEVFLRTSHVDLQTQGVDLLKSGEGLGN